MDEALTGSRHHIGGLGLVLVCQVHAGSAAAWSSVKAGQLRGFCDPAYAHSRLPM